MGVIVVAIVFFYADQAQSSAHDSAETYSAVWTLEGISGDESHIHTAELLEGAQRKGEVRSEKERETEEREKERVFHVYDPNNHNM